MSGQTLRYLQRKAMIAFYARPRVILRHITGRTISLRNFILGGVWLVSLFWSALMRRVLFMAAGFKR
jgi:hypothetical protein